MPCFCAISVQKWNLEGEDRALCTCDKRDVSSISQFHWSNWYFYRCKKSDDKIFGFMKQMDNVNILRSLEDPDVKD